MAEKRGVESRFRFAVANSGLRPDLVAPFREIIYRHYREHGRSFPWRDTDNPYHILVSEIMLQQTQTDRVATKYGEFIDAFPDIFSLARAPLTKILREWQGLGYNRRALALKELARLVVGKHSGVLPSRVGELEMLPGIGRATASEIAAFAFNRPAVFIETNIRSVFIHFFFGGRNNVKDAEILPLVEKTLDAANPREWYYALMDYGVMLKKRHPNPGRRSAHYQRQTPFKGSNRQLRGMILRTLIEAKAASGAQLVKKLALDPVRVKGGLAQLQKEGFIKERKKRYSIA